MRTTRRCSQGRQRGDSIGTDLFICFSWQSERLQTPWQVRLAVNDYDLAIQLAPNDGGLFIDRGKVLRTQSKFDQAISDFTHALDLDKKWTAAYRERGLTYKQMGQSPAGH